MHGDGEHGASGGNASASRRCAAFLVLLFVHFHANVVITDFPCLECLKLLTWQEHSSLKHGLTVSPPGHLTEG
jgi:hypothetical protein